MAGGTVLEAEKQLDSMVGKVVVLIHPAWHSCGSHQVFCVQARAYMAMGARVAAIAVGTTLDRGLRNKPFWQQYYSHSGDLIADWRAHTGPSRYGVLLDGNRRQLARNLSEADYARQMAGLTELSPIPPVINELKHLDLIHCNHYFNMPLALRLKEKFGAPILLETHDVQARQYELRGAKSLIRKRQDDFETMVKSELELVRQADWLAHINVKEFEFFSQRLPEMKHSLLYPAVVNMQAKDEEKGFFLIVASGNYPNFESVSWFLRRVVPLCDDINVKIIGDVDHEVRTREPGLYECHKGKFIGRVKDLSSFYDNTIAVLLPTRSGHGLSIKTIEAMATGAPLIGTTLAFRGMDIDLATISNLSIGNTEQEFAALINAAQAKVIDEIAIKKKEEGEAVDRAELMKRTRAVSDTRLIAKRLFGFQNYQLNLSNIAGQLISLRAA